MITLKKSTQWDVFGVFALMLGLGTVICLFGGYFPKQWYSNPSSLILWLIVSGIAVLFSAIGFIFGFLEGKKEEQREFNPSKR